MKKRFVVGLAGLLAVALLAGCSGVTDSGLSQAAGSEATSAASGVDSVTGATPGEVVLSTEELAAYNGKDGMPAYVAVNGIIYDVTDVPEWANGEHAGGRLTAGQDLTEQITNESPHGLSVLDDLPVVGRLSDG